MVDPKCGGCEVAVYMRPYEAIIKGRKILKPSLRYQLPVSVAPAPTGNPAFHPARPSSFKPYTAQFLIFTHGTKRIFTDPKYHQQSPAVFLTANDSSTIHIEREGVTWADFFATLPFKLNHECLITGTNQTFCQTETQSLSFYLNGKLDPEVLTKVIQPNDQLLVTVSPPTNSQLDQQLHSFP